jgi:serine/threonine protein phosphatase 1
MRTLVIGDIHGGYLALKQVLERSNFNYEEDRLISLGDVVDGWEDSFECVEELLKIKNLIAISGNHDWLFLQWMIKGMHPFDWTHGGLGTLKSYLRNCLGNEDAYTSYNGEYKSKLTVANFPEQHIKFFHEIQQNYFVDENKFLYVHGGYNRHHSILNPIHNSEEVLHWDRDLWTSAMSYNASKNNSLKFKLNGSYNKVFIGHTPTINWGTILPMKAGPVWNLDTGAAYTGVLTIMDVNIEEYWQSDKLTDLYPNQKGRN